MKMSYSLLNLVRQILANHLKYFALTYFRQSKKYKIKNCACQEFLHSILLTELFIWVNLLFLSMFFNTYVELAFNYWFLFFFHRFIKLSTKEIPDRMSKPTLALSLQAHKTQPNFSFTLQIRTIPKSTVWSWQVLTESSTQPNFPTCMTSTWSR